MFISIKENPFEIRKLPKFIGIQFLQHMGKETVTTVMEHPNVRKLMKSDEKFDVCFLEVFHAHALIGIFDHFNCVYIPYTSAGVKQWVDFITSKYEDKLISSST